MMRWGVGLLLLLTVSGLARAQSGATPPSAVDSALLAHAESGNADAQFELGWALHEVALANGADEQFVVAAQWIRRAADQGHLLAQVRLGNLYEWGHGVPEDAAESVRWYRRAADAGLPQAQFALGLALRRGAGITQNSTEARTWMCRAAEGGFPVAAFALAEMSRTGEGVSADIVEAYAWLIVAGSGAEVPPFAVTARNQLRPQLDAEGLAEAERRADTHLLRIRTAALPR